MHISQNLNQYLANSKIICGSNIIITDFEKIRLAELSNDNIAPNITVNDELSDDILNLIKKWNSYNIDKSNLFCIMNYYCLNLIKHDSNNYSSQMIFPLFNKKNKLLGLLILFRTTKNYIISSTKSAITMAKSVNNFINNEEN